MINQNPPSLPLPLPLQASHSLLITDVYALSVGESEVEPNHYVAIKSISGNILKKHVDPLRGPGLGKGGGV